MLVCGACAQEAGAEAVFQPRCNCGGLFRWDSREAPKPRLWTTPLWREPVHRNRLWKREDLNPTGSFKDRGAETLVRVAVASGAKQFVLDSSGSAALAGARVAAQAGIPLTIETPSGISERRRERLQILGAQVRSQGTRSETAVRAESQAQEAFWFSHVYHPAFSHGISGMVDELCPLKAQMPLLWYVPVGNGSLILGLDEGLKRLGLQVRLVAVQAASCPGLMRPGAAGLTRAGGIGIADPPRRHQILSILQDPKRDIVEVSEEAIQHSQDRLARMGVLADPASAAVHAALEKVNPSEPTLGILTGAGSR